MKSPCAQHGVLADGGYAADLPHAVGFPLASPGVLPYGMLRDRERQLLCENEGINSGKKGDITGAAVIVLIQESSLAE